MVGFDCYQLTYQWLIIKTKNLYKSLLVFNYPFPSFHLSASKVMNPIPFTGNDLNIVTPSPLTNVLAPSSLYFNKAAFMAEGYFLFSTSSDCKIVFT